MSPISVDAWFDRSQQFNVDGHDIAYWSEGTGRPLLLIHGYPTCTWDWSWIWDELSSTRRVIACDLLGFGLSAKPRAGYSINRQTDLQARLLEHCDINEFDVLAHDYGDTVAQELLARHNERSGFHGLGRMALLNGGLFPEQHRLRPIQRLGISPIGFLVGLMMNRRAFDRAFSEIFGPSTQPSKDELDGYWRFITRGRGHRIIHKLLHYIAERHENRQRWVGALQDTRVPLKLVDGGADPVSGKHMYETFRELVPQAEAVCFPEIGHYPHTEAPDRVLNELRPFLSLTGESHT